MDYNVSLVDRHGENRVLYLSAGGGVRELHSSVCTNHQTQVAWPAYEKMTSTREREEYLESLMGNPHLTLDGLVDCFLSAPLYYQPSFSSSFGTLYTSLWKPATGSMKLLWPGAVVDASFAEFVPQSLSIHLTDAH